MALILAGCVVGGSVPSGAQEVQIVATASEVRLAPPVVRAGEVYLVLDESTSSIVLVQRLRPPEISPGSLTDADLSRLAEGDTEGTSIEGFDTINCDAEQREEERGQLKVPGGCGNAFAVTLSPGMYAILAEDPTGQPPGSQTPMAVLEVVP